MVPGVSQWRWVLTSTVVVTGAAGYLGGRLVTSLTGQGHDVRGVSRHPAPWLPVPAEIVDLADDAADIVSILEGADALVHLAGVNQQIAAADPRRCLAETTAAAHNVASAASAAGVERVVHVSTVHVYGAALAPGAHVDESTVTEPRSTYALSRLITEHILAMHEPDLVVLRLTNGVGPPVSPHMTQWSLVVNDLSRQAVSTGSLELHSDGQQYRDFVSLDDVCHVIDAAMQAERVPAGVYNFASGASITIRDVAEMVRDAVDRVTGDRPSLRMLEPKGPPLPPYVVSADAMAGLGFRAETPLQTSVEETVRFCVDHRSDISGELP